MCCDPASEPSQRDGSDEGSQHMVLMRNKKNYQQIIPYLELWSVLAQDFILKCLNIGTPKNC